MIEPEEIEKLLNCYVAVGCPHFVVEGKLYYYYGFLRNINTDNIKIEKRDGFKIIPIEQVMEIHKVENNEF